MSTDARKLPKDPQGPEPLRSPTRLQIARLGRIRLPLGAKLLVIFVLLAAVAAGCANGTYPLDIFYEMHYQQSYKSHEPPRLWAPEGAVPVTGRPIFETDNPIRGQRVDEGKVLFMANCVFCHGETGNGEDPELQGEVLRIMRVKHGYGTEAQPYTITPDLTSDFVKDQNDLALFGWITNGVTVMPRFNKLLTVEERWLLVNYIRTLSD